MPEGGDSRTPVVCDTCVLVAFAQIERVDLLVRHPRFRFVVPDQVLDEVTRVAQREQLDEAIARGGLELVVSSDPVEIELAVELRRVLGRGEAVAIAVAWSRSWCIATDERGRTRRVIAERLGERRLLTTPGILLEAIRGGLSTVAEADALKARLESHRMRMTFGSFGELLSGP